MTGFFNIAVAFAAQRKKKVESKEHLLFKDVYDSNFAFAWRSLLGLGVPRSAIDDAAQDVFIVVHRKLDTLQDHANIKSWIFLIARRVASDYRRSQRRKGTSVEFDESKMGVHENTPYSDAVERETLGLVEQFLSNLDEERRSMFVLSEIEQLPVSEVATILDVNQNTIYSRLKVIRNDLSLFMAKYTSDRNRE